VRGNVEPNGIGSLYQKKRSLRELLGLITN